MATATLGNLVTPFTMNDGDSAPFIARVIAVEESEGLISATLRGMADCGPRGGAKPVTMVVLAAEFESFWWDVKTSQNNTPGSYGVLTWLSPEGTVRRNCITIKAFSLLVAQGQFDPILASMAGEDLTYPLAYVQMVDQIPLLNGAVPAQQPSPLVGGLPTYYKPALTPDGDRLLIRRVDGATDYILIANGMGVTSNSVLGTGP